MKKLITKSEQAYINRLLDARKNKRKLTITNEMLKDRLVQEKWDTKVSMNGLTYLEIEQLDNTFNNFR